MDAGVLDEIGILQGTDKSSLRWDYLRHYQEIFRDWRDCEFNLIEIGVAGGSSLFGWRRFFTRAKIVGIDISESARRCARDGIEIEIGSQADPSFLKAVGDKYPPSIVIDDGSHQADHIMISFQTLFPRLAPGGWYVIEDLNLTYGQNNAPITPHAFLGQAAQALLNRRPDPHSDIAVTDIDRIDIASGITFVRKKDAKSQGRRLRESVGCVWRTKDANNYFWLAEQLSQGDGADLAQAEASARRAVELHPNAAVYHIGLSKILRQRQNKEGAIEAARAAVAAEPGSLQGHFQLGVALLGSGNLRQADESFDKSIEIAPSHLRVHLENERRRIVSEAP